MRGLILGFILLFLSGCKTAPVQQHPSEEMSAGMDKEAIRAVIRDNLVPIRHCYEKELKSHKDLKGKLVLEWDIESGGKVSKVTVKKPFNAAVDQCIAEVIKAAKFPEPPKGSVGRVAYPFVFSDI